MAASQSAASNALSRSKAVVAVVTAFAAALGIYYIHRTIYSDANTTTALPGPGLHRSNAVHRPRRHPRTSDDDDTFVDHRRASFTSAEEDYTHEISGVPGDGETVVDEQRQDDWNWDPNAEEPPTRNGQNIIQLLYRVSEDATRRKAYVHRGCLCNVCGVVPIRGIRYRCSNCADFDLCEACEAQGLHTKTHIFYKVRVPTSSFAARQMQPVWYPGDPDTCQKVLPRELIPRLLKETGFDRAELDAYWEQWTFMANTEWREDPDDLCLAMDRKTFDQCLVPSDGHRYAVPNLIHDRMFSFYDINHDDLISFPEFLNGLAFRKRKDKLRRVFEGYDINEDGFVDRKDFLRIFRSYYVLYKHMHRDMLEGLDDQVMNSTDAHQLITSRQPLSSAFGRDGRFPSAPDPRTGEGKQLGPDGDLEIVDGKGILNDSGNDLGNKEDVLIDSVVRDYNRRSQSNMWEPTGGSTYWRAVMNPPRTITSLQNDVLESLLRESHGRNQHIEPTESTRSSWDLRSSNDHVEDEIADIDWPPSFVQEADVEAVCGHVGGFRNVPYSSRDAVVEHALRRLRNRSVNDQTLAVNEEIHERWKRRHFYTDEEEGATPPPDWKEEEDIPAPNGKAVEGGKDSSSQSRPISPRSRSSSKVRFAEDTDDYEIRSNPSTSSRSVPERWGGIDIPDAEKDAGKEILYQVTQQAFNELLDPLFKAQEDRAIAALSSRDVRAKYKHLYTNPHFEGWAIEVDKSLSRTKSSKSRFSVELVKEIRSWRESPTMTEVELVDVRQQPLNQLLSVSGYSVQGEPSAMNGFNDHNVDESEAISGNVLPNEVARPSSDQGLEEASQEDLQRLVNAILAVEKILSESMSEDLREQRDPTLPQFRPDSLPGQTQWPESQGSSRLFRHEPFALIRSTSESPALNDLRNLFTSRYDFSRSEVAYYTKKLQAIQDSGNVPPLNEPLFLRQEPNNVRSSQLHTAVSPHHPAAQNGIDSASQEEADEFQASDSDIEIERDPALDSPSDREVFRLDEYPERNVVDDDSTAIHIEAHKKRLQILKENAISALERHLTEPSDAAALSQFKKISWMKLYKWREMEITEQEAEARGGWGRLSWEEFERLVKGTGDESPGDEMRRRVTMDYLGSWIEFCIP